MNSVIKIDLNTKLWRLKMKGIKKRPIRVMKNVNSGAPTFA